MSYIPSEFKYTATHEWVSIDEEGLIIVGITDYAQSLLGDIVYVELPDVGLVLKAAEEFGVIESVKAASDLYSPLTGEIVAVNEALAANPALINQDPYHDGWLIKIKAEDSKDVEDLMDADEYEEKIAAEQQ